MNVGDLIRRKDMPQIIYRIVGEDICGSRVDLYKWMVEVVTNPRGLRKKGFIFKDDERWEVVE